MSQLIRIKDIAAHDGQEVTVQGWVYSRTGKGRLQFILLRDGSGQAQCVAFKREMSPEDLNWRGLDARVRCHHSRHSASGRARAG